MQADDCNGCAEATHGRLHVLETNSQTREKQSPEMEDKYNMSYDSSVSTRSGYSSESAVRASSHPPEIARRRQDSSCFQDSSLAGKGEDI